MMVLLSFHFYRATACNATHGSVKVVLSACPSVCQTWIVTNIKKETCAHILIPHKRSFILVFWQEEWFVGATPSTWNGRPNWPGWSENADFLSIFAVAPQP